MSRGGRPPKYGEPTRQISIRLPVSTLEVIARVGPRPEVIVWLVAEAMEAGLLPTGEVEREPDHTHSFVRGLTGLFRCRCGQVK